MKRFAALLAVAAVASGLTVMAPAAAASKATYYLSVGDSLAQGYQPIGGPWRPLGVNGYAHGYADALFKAVRDRYEQLQLVKLGCGGERQRRWSSALPGAAFPPAPNSPRPRSS
jgi:hypothetical protein